MDKPVFDAMKQSYLEYCAALSDEHLQSEHGSNEYYVRQRGKQVLDTAAELVLAKWEHRLHITTAELARRKAKG